MISKREFDRIERWAKQGDSDAGSSAQLVEIMRQARIGRIVEASGVTADDCLDTAVQLMNIEGPVGAMLRSIAEALRKEQGR